MATFIPSEVNWFPNYNHLIALIRFQTEGFALFGVDFLA